MMTFWLAKTFLQRRGSVCGGALALEVYDHLTSLPIVTSRVPLRVPAFPDEGTTPFAVFGCTQAGPFGQRLSGEQLL